MNTLTQLPRYWQVGIVNSLGLVLAFYSNCALAQITPDDTLGGENSIVTPNIPINGLPGVRIDGGAIRGTHLFHSFLEFNVGNGQRVYFANPIGIENILSRVTGTDPSDILGTLGVDGTANLFFLNPNGIIFGSNARLDIRGSFLGSTADSLVFGNGSQFSATNRDAPPLLTINVPIGLQYGPNHPGATIANQGNLAVGQDLTLAAGNLDLRGQLQAGRDLTLQAEDTVQLRDSTVEPFVAAARGKLLVQGNQEVDIFALNHPDSGLFSGGDIVLRSANPVGGDAHYSSGGTFRIEQLDGSIGNLFSPHDPIIRASGDVSFGSYTGASLHIFAGGSVTIGNITITGTDTVANSIQEKVTLSDGTVVDIDGNNQPTVDIRAGTTAFGTSGITPVNPPGFIPNLPPTGGTATSANIDIGNITNPGGVVLLTNQYQPNTTLAGNITVGSINTAPLFGDGGNIFIDSRGETTLDGIVDTSSSSVGDFVFLGNGGDITLLAKDDITLNPGATLESIGLSGGNITLTSDNGNLSINDGIVSSITTGTGTGGDINLKAQSIFLNNFARVANLTAGSGQGGDTIVEATDTVQLVYEGGLSIARPNNLFVELLFFADPATGIRTSTLGAGDSGNITIDTSRLLLRNQPGSNGKVGITTSTFVTSDGRGGDLTVNASDSVEIIGNDPEPFIPKIDDKVADEIIRLSTGLTTATNGNGDGGDLTINTRRLTIRDGAAASSGNTLEATGNGGRLTVNVTDSVQLRGKAGLITAATGSGNAGELIVEVPTGEVTLRDGSGISTDTLGSGNAARLNINTTRLSIRDGSRIGAATAAEGSGATISVSADSVEVVGTSADGTVQSGLFTSATPTSTGAAGDLNIDTRRLVVKDGGRVSASTAGAGAGGTLNLSASEYVEVVGTSADNQTSSSLFFDASSTGDAGSLKITTPRLSVLDGGRVSASTSGDGNAGTLELNASELVEVIGTSADGSTPSRLFFDSSGTGDAGELAIATSKLVVRDGGQVSAATSGTGQGGILAVNATESIEVSGSSGSSASGLFFDSRGAGDARGIKIDTGNLVVENGGQITVSGTGTGISGDLEITADSILLNHQGQLRATTAASEGGNIRLQVADSIILRDNSEISAEAFGTAKGGNITIEAGNFIIAFLPENSDIVASAFEGQGGNISAQATGIFGFRQFQGFRTPDSDFTATSELGIDGILEVITRDDLRLEALSDDFLNDQDQPTQGCPTFGSNSSAQFYNTGRGGLPTSPYEPLGSDEILEDVQLPMQGSENPAETDSSLMTSPDRIVEAQGWIITDQGEVILVAQMPVSLTPNHCHLR